MSNAEHAVTLPDDNLWEMFKDTPSHFVHGVNRTLFKYLANERYGSLRGLALHIENTPHLKREINQLFPKHQNLVNLVVRWRLGELRPKYDDRGKAIIQFFSYRIFPGVSPMYLYTFDVFEFIPPEIRDEKLKVRICGRCRKSLLVGHPESVITSSGAWHRKCYNEHHLELYHKRVCNVTYLKDRRENRAKESRESC